MMCQQVEGMRVLVAEDDHAVRDLLRTTLELEGLVVDEVTNGTALLRTARETKPDLVLLDVHLGHDDGFELCRRLKSDPDTAGSGVIFLTARHHVNDRVRGLQLGAVDYVCKPFAVEELLARVGAALRVKQTHDTLQARQRELAILAETDALTGLINRRGFPARFERACRDARLTQQPLSIALIDIDRFKQINDHFGHDVGDHALRLLADVLRAEVRNDDVVVRWGGEEFLLLLPHTDCPGALALLDRIRMQLRALTIHVGDEVMALRVSGGITEIRPGEGEEAIQRADELLLRAKRDGRDRVYTA